MKLSRPVVYFFLLALVACVVIWTSDSPSGPPPVAQTKKKAKKADPGWDYPPQPPLRYTKPKPLARNVFAPLIHTEKIAKAPEAKDDLVQIPSNFADGESSWAYTGMAEVDGVRMALLENSTKKQSGYVREGEAWKKARVVGISTACIVLSDDKGETQTVYRYNPNDPPKEKPVTDGGFRPTGAIGGNLSVRPLVPPPPPGVITRS